MSSEVATPPGDDLGVAEVRERAVRGAWQLVGRMLVTRGLGLAGVVYLSRSLGPEVMGVLALAASVQTVGHIVADAGLGAALIAREEPPRPRELGAILGLQLAATIALAAAATVVAGLFGGAATVIAISMWSLPGYVLRSAPAVLADRRLDFRPAALGDILESVVFVGLSVAAVAAGYGAREVAVATVIAAWLGSVVILTLVPAGRVRPLLAIAEVRGLLAFSTKVQAAQVLEICRGQLLNGGIIAFGGLRVLAFAGISDRVTQIPSFVLTPVQRVAFPAFSRIEKERSAELGRVAIRGVRTLICLVGFVVVPLAAACALGVEPVFGARWTDATPLVVSQLVTLLLGLPASYVVGGLLLARNEVGRLLEVQVATAAVSVVAGCGLLLALGPLGLGLGLGLASFVELVLFDRLVRRRFASSLLLGVLPAFALAAGVAGAAVAGSTLLEPSFGAAAAVGAISLLAYAAGVLLCFADVIAVLAENSPAGLTRRLPTRLTRRAGV